MVSRVLWFLKQWLTNWATHMKHNNTTLTLSSAYDKSLLNNQTVGSVKHSSQISKIYLKIQKKESRNIKLTQPCPQAHFILGIWRCRRKHFLWYLKRNYSQISQCQLARVSLHVNRELKDYAEVGIKLSPPTHFLKENHFNRLV